jgi:NAD(P)-dependent dehydrogenase (short-subunit alcohol dehydrogenase family)
LKEGDQYEDHNSGKWSAPRGLLEGKVAIVTGASRGIGAAIVNAFADAGASVVLAARDDAALADLAETITSKGGEAVVVRTDVGDAAAVEALVEATLARFGRLDAAVNKRRRRKHAGAARGR